MGRLGCAIAAALIGFVASPLAQRPTAVPSVDLVELDVTAVDRQGRPVRGLTQNDFTVKEDGHVVPLVTFTEVSSTLPTEDSGRTIVLLLDDAGVPATGTGIMQFVARAFVDSLRPTDDLAVMRLNERGDEAYGDRPVAESRIAGYKASAASYIPWRTPQLVLTRVAEAAGQLSISERKRKIIACIGSPAVCNPLEPQKGSPGGIWNSWAEMLTVAATANVSVYALVPANARFRSGGLVEFTGGEYFSTSRDLGPAIDRILQDAANYYVLGYWPQPGKDRDLHSIEVKTSRSGVKVRSRRQRGN